MNKIIQGNCLDSLKTLPENSVDAIVTDPPYGLSFMGKKWDYDVPSTDIWEECLRVLKPGGYLLAFAGTRTQHRMAIRIEDAGFEIRDMIAWVYGSGFPKSLNIGKAVDKLQGNEREVSGYEERFGREGRKAKCGFKEEYVGASGTQDQSAMKPIMLPVSEEAKQWEGWGTALKPALEPITVARKPLSEKTVAENVLKWGTGGINIDGSRVDGKTEIHSNGKRSMYGGNSLLESKTHNDKTEIKDYGRFPANLILEDCEEVRECFPETKTGKAIRSNSGGKTFGGENTKPVMEDLGYDDNGGNASRFFKSIIYQAKASKSERNKGTEELDHGNNHATVKPIALMEYLVKLVTKENAVVLDPFTGSGSTLVACKNTNRNYIGMELDTEYIKIAEARLNV